MTDSLLKRELPKWPQMAVNGKRITVPQAREIIRRTDIFFARPNPHDASTLVMLAGLRMPYRSPESYDLRSYYNRLETWQKTWGCINLEFLWNDWMDSSYISGATGWCHPDGWIEHHGTVGKWPRAEDLLNEWKILASTFQFLELDVTISDVDWSHSRQPILGFRIRKGQVEAVDPLEVKLHADYPISTPSFHDPDAYELMSHGFAHRSLIPDEWLEIWFKEADRLFGATSEAVQIQPDRPPPG